jgi:hypothetical protein
LAVISAPYGLKGSEIGFGTTRKYWQEGLMTLFSAPTIDQFLADNSCYLGSLIIYAMTCRILGSFWLDWIDLVIRDENLGLGTFEPASGAGVLPSEESAPLASPYGDIAAAGALELDRLLTGGYLLATGDTRWHFAQLTIKPTAEYLKVKQASELP